MIDKLTIKDVLILITWVQAFAFAGIYYIIYRIKQNTETTLKAISVIAKALTQKVE
jgi:hypothetical protein